MSTLLVCAVVAGLGDSSGLGASSVLGDSSGLVASSVLGASLGFFYSDYLVMITSSLDVCFCEPGIITPTT